MSQGRIVGEGNFSTLSENGCLQQYLNLDPNTFSQPVFEQPEKNNGKLELNSITKSNNNDKLQQQQIEQNEGNEAVLTTVEEVQRGWNRMNELNEC